MIQRIQLIIIILLSFVIDKSCAQYKDNYWVFGDIVAIDWSNPSNPIFKPGSFYYRNGSCSVGDSLGLILYAGRLNNILPNNSVIWNKFDIQISGSDHIYGNVWYHAGLFVPHPINDSIFYLFTIGVTAGDPLGFYYTTINYKSNSDSGAIIQKNVQLNNSPAFDALMGVKHGNGRDWWVVSQRYTLNFAPTNAFYFFLISESGVSGPFQQNIGSVHTTNLGHLVFSNNGEKFANLSIRGLIELYNFDRCTGLISSTIPIEQEPLTSPYLHWYSSCAFSPDDTKLYVVEYSVTNNPSYLWQFDLTASNIANSKLLIDSFIDPNMGVAQLKLAANGNIYMSASDESFSWPYPDTSTAYTTINNNLCVINYPDSLGAACDFQPFSFNLGAGRSYFGLPNNPDYELGAWVGSPCDTLTVGITENDEKNDVFFQTWYNPEWNMIHVNAAKLKGKSGLLRLFDMEGRVVVERKVSVINGGYFTGEIAMNGIASGVYIVSLTTEKDKVQGKVLKF